MFMDFLVEKASAAHRAVLVKRPPLLIHRRALRANHCAAIPSESYDGMKAKAASAPAPIGGSAAFSRAQQTPLFSTPERFIYAGFLRLRYNKARERRGLV